MCFVLVSHLWRRKTNVCAKHDKCRSTSMVLCLQKNLFKRVTIIGDLASLKVVEELLPV